MSSQQPSRADPERLRSTDYLLIFTGVVALASMVVLYASDKNILPEIVSTYTLQPVIFFNKKRRGSRTPWSRARCTRPRADGQSTVIG